MKMDPPYVDASSAVVAAVTAEGESFGSRRGSRRNKSYGGILQREKRSAAPD
jgi:hypothetical protein